MILRIVSRGKGDKHRMLRKNLYCSGGSGNGTRITRILQIFHLKTSFLEETWFLTIRVIRVPFWATMNVR
jgi:hypothetical protein